MSPFRVLGIDPTDNKIMIRRAYVDMTKKYHPDHGGDPVYFQAIQNAYQALISGDYKQPVTETNVELTLNELLTGCTADAILTINGQPVMVEFRVPPMSYPGTVITFDSDQFEQKLAIKLHVAHDPEYNLLNQHVLIQREINTHEAQCGIVLEIENFDGTCHNIKIPPATSANKLIYEIEGQGFFDKKTKKRGKLTVLVTIKKKVN